MTRRKVTPEQFEKIAEKIREFYRQTEEQEDQE